MPLPSNEHGQVVGDSETAKGEFHAWLWEHKVMTDLGTLGGTISSTSQFGGPKKVINNRGQIVGGSDTATGEFRPVIWTKPGKH
jgi:probable HAF family extracellular repeat protein